MSSTKPYRINEIFASLQGEGFWTGTPAVFVRMAGCNRACPFCDTDFSAYTLMTAEEIVTQISPYNIDTVIITGGEPALQLDDNLVEALHRAGKRVHVETNGTLPLPDGVDWVTCSPKQGPWLIRRVDELKVVYQGQSTAELDDLVHRLRPAHRFLQPCWGDDPLDTIEYIMQHPLWRLSLQSHKLINIK